MDETSRNVVKDVWRRCVPRSLCLRSLFDSPHIMIFADLQHSFTRM
jgi:hypothetical protein